MDFLRFPSPEELNQDNPNIHQTVNRACVSYEPNFQRFIIYEKSFTQQFSHIYSRRLWQLRERITIAASLKNQSDNPIEVLDKIINLRTDCIVTIVGVLYKEMKKRPSVLREYRASTGKVEKQFSAEGNFTSDDDFLYLEDQSGRVRINIDDRSVIEKQCTGLVVGVVGLMQGNGEFKAIDFISAELPQQPQIQPQINSNPCYVLLVSSLKIGSNFDPLTFQLLVDFLIGASEGNATDEKKEQLRSIVNPCDIARIIIAGDSISPSNAELLSEKHLSNQQQEKLIEPIKELDVFISQLTTSLEVDLMPGSTDPSNFTLPQQPFHHCLFPISARFSSFRCVTNPYEASIGGRIFLGTSGQNISNIEQYTRQKDPNSALKIMEQLISCGHLAPTAPDTLPCYPFIHVDPFVIDRCPHVFFAGNQKNFETTLITGNEQQICRLISVPAFNETGQAVLVNLDTLDCDVINFMSIT